MSLISSCWDPLKGAMNAGDGIPVSKIMDIHMKQFQSYGHIWKDTVPGMERIVTTVRPEDAEK